MNGDVRVGGMVAPAAEAKRYVTRYLTSRDESWAYPAYDGYPGGPTDLVSEQDLFAPTLLNAGINKLAAYYAILDQLPEINSRLAAVPVDVPLARADAAQVAAVAHLIGVLNGGAIKGVRLTKLSKVLHRKRPQIFPLYDDHIRACYQDGPDAPVPTDRERSWEDFAALWLGAVQTDLTEQAPMWEKLACLTPPGGPAITPLRALDIVGWGLGQPGRKNWVRYAVPSISR